MDLSSFQKRLGVPLAKSTSPSDFSGLRKETDPSALDVVDHTPDLKAHPHSHSAAVEEYRKAISESSPLLRTTPKKLEGVSAKVLYKVHSPNNLPHGKAVLVKPYHEKLHPKSKYWQGHPIQGWAEMTNQSLWHAAGIGAAHQLVHVSEHDMGPGFEKHPALVIHMDPDSTYSEDLEHWMYDPAMGKDAVKIGVMDFLSNNIDRHRHNLLIKPLFATDSTGMPDSTRLLGIDHGRSFQYHASHKGIPSHVEDPLFGRMDVPEDVRTKKNAEGKAVDNLMPYLQSDALQFVNDAARMHGVANLHHPNTMLPVISDWWPKVRNRVVSAFQDRLLGIKEPRMKQHLLDNFNARVEKLDDIAFRPEWYKAEGRISDLDVPMKVWDR